MSFRYGFFYFMLLFVFAQGVLASSAFAENNSSFFEKFEKFQNTNPNIHQWATSVESPWYGYLNHHFDEALSPKENQDYLAWQKLGRCLDVIQMDVLGFLKANRELISVFEKYEYIREFFEDKIAVRYSRGFQRCQSHILLRSYGFFKKQSSLFKFLEFGGLGKSGRDYVYTKEQKVRLVELETIMKLAICDDYQAAQIDLLNWHNELFSTLIPDDAYYYLAQRLERKKVYKFQNELKLKKIKLKNWRLIDEAAFEGNIKKLRFALPYWFQSCTKMKPIRF